MSSKFDRSRSVRKTPAICKAVGDSFRFVTVPFKREMSWSVVANISDSISDWETIGTGTLHQQGNPLQIWKGTIGLGSGDHAQLRLDYETLLNILTIHFIAFEGVVGILTRVRIILNIDLKKPFGTLEIELPPDPPGGRIVIQILY